MRTRHYPSDLTDAQWALVAPHIPAAKAGGRPRTTDIRAVLDAIIYLLRTGCQWRQLPCDFPPWPTVHGYFRDWRMAGVWVLLHRALYPLARMAAGRKPEPTLAIMDGQSVKTTESGGVRGFDGHKRVKGRKRHILVDILGLPIANRVEPANMSDRRAGSRLLAGLAPVWPTIRTVVADAGHESRKLARQLRHDGWSLQIVKRKQRTFRVAGLTWIVERSFAWLGFNRRLSKDYERYVQTSETLLDIAAIRLMLSRVAPVSTSHTASYRGATGAAMADPAGEGDRRELRLGFDSRLLLPTLRIGFGPRSPRILVGSNPCSGMSSSPLPNR